MLNPATPAFLDTLRARLPAATFREAGPEHLQEPRGRYTGQGLLLAPSSTEEVATILQACHAARIGVVLAMRGPQARPEATASRRIIVCLYIHIQYPFQSQLI